MKSVTLVAVILLIVGGINWGLVGAFGFNLVEALFGESTVLTRIVYILVGLAAVWKMVVFVTDKSVTSRD